MEEESHQLTKKERRELARSERKVEHEHKESFSKLRKVLFAVIPVLVLAFIGYKTFKFLSEPVDTQVLHDSVEVNDTDWVRGKTEAKITLLEYGDFQCPACRDYEPFVQQLGQDFPDDLRIVFRHFPLIMIHNRAYDAARASEAAGNQGKFWEMHDLLYEKQDEWVKASNHKDKFNQYAKDLGLDEEKFKSDFGSKEVEERINSGLASGKNFGVNATPTLYLNGQKIQPKSYDEFKKAVEGQIQGYNVE